MDKVSNKNRKILSEIGSFVKGTGNKACQSIISMMQTLNITEKQMGWEKAPNCKMTCRQVLDILLLLPFLGIKNIHGMRRSMVGNRILPCGKDTFYNFMKSDDIDWRRIILHVAKRMIGMFTISGDHDRREQPSCLIADDTDIEALHDFIESARRMALLSA